MGTNSSSICSVLGQWNGLEVGGAVDLDRPRDTPAAVFDRSITSHVAHS